MFSLRRSLCICDDLFCLGMGILQFRLLGGCQLLCGLLLLLTEFSIYALLVVILIIFVL